MGRRENLGMRLPRRRSVLEILLAGLLVFGLSANCFRLFLLSCVQNVNNLQKSLFSFILKICFSSPQYEKITPIQMGDRTPQQHTYFHPKVGIEEQFDSFSILIGMIIKRCDYLVMAGILDNATQDGQILIKTIIQYSRCSI